MHTTGTNLSTRERERSCLKPVHQVIDEIGVRFAADQLQSGMPPGFAAVGERLRPQLPSALLDTSVRVVAVRGHSDRHGLDLSSHAHTLNVGAELFVGHR